MTISPRSTPGDRADRTAPSAGTVPRPRPAMDDTPDLRPGTDGDSPATGWLRPTGRVPAVLSAWGHGVLAEVPTGIAWDVVRVPSELGPDTVRRLRATRAPLGPVLTTPLGTDFVVAPGSADGWAVTGTSVLGRGTLVLLPPPETVEPRRVGSRGWLVAPDGRGTLTRAADLRDAYTEALSAAAAAQESAAVEPA
ncbi:hypothetical protein F0L17_06840 [Streptomyces sp. TRM43335]|uniref:DNA primase/polymerase bifunctional N-terminal domain-containing protein n=1 Tax=Streptomyces taklimakanensis TaxID=2569853 RepID=A0A6G2B9P9_9ACTN|nr:hypothetical protein [Streptomyces taklimakanensis]MTE18856.1 hypothetical protein [Streptomyces taklimakanensis]